jgi:hypothetical protein
MAEEQKHLLVVEEGPNPGQTYPLEEMVCTIGRVPDNTIVVDDKRISRYHTQLRVLPDGVVAEDLGSTNGTWVNNRPLTSPRPLVPGDRLRLADCIIFQYVAEQSIPAPMEPTVPTRRPPAPADEDPLSTHPPRPAYAQPYAGAEPQPAAIEPESPARTAPATSNKWLYAGIVTLVVLTILCLALAIYLWFAPLEFWLRLFELFGIPTPTAHLHIG